MGAAWVDSPFGFELGLLWIMIIGEDGVVMTREVSV